MELYCLHGFLGNPQDWDFVKESCLKQGVDCHAISCWPSLSGASASLVEWAQHFCAEVAKDSKGPRILVGYSMGGRLALHALLEKPHLWEHALIVSAHYGLEEEAEKEARCLQDRRWAGRFRSEPWEDLIKAWNGQGVFGGQREQRMQRKEEDFVRESLARALEEWSLGKQAFLLPRLGEVCEKLTWLVGAEDSKFCALIEREEFRTLGVRALCWAGVGHRVPWEAQERFLSLLGALISLRE